MYLDLTQPLDSQTPVAPILPSIEEKELTTIAREGANISLCSFATHSGTHIDAPYHFIEGGKRIRDIPLEWLCGPASFVELPHGSGEPVTAAELEDAGDHVRAGDRLFVSVGWDRHFYEDEYKRHPYFDEDAADWLVDRGVRMLAADLITPDKPHHLRGADPYEYGFPVHMKLLGSEVLIVENVSFAGHRLPDRFDVSVLPLPLSLGDGSPVRIAASV